VWNNTFATPIKEWWRHEVRSRTTLRKPRSRSAQAKIANSVEAVQDVRIYIEKINWPLAIARGWLWLHDSGNYVKFTQGQRGAVRVKEAAS
jgi:hypothetical protein